MLPYMLVSHQCLSNWVCLGGGRFSKIATYVIEAIVYIIYVAEINGRIVSSTLCRQASCTVIIIINIQQWQSARIIDLSIIWCVSCDCFCSFSSFAPASRTMHLQNRKDQANVVFWLGVLCAFAFLCALMLPETRGRIPPDTIDEVRLRKFKKTLSSAAVSSTSL